MTKPQKPEERKRRGRPRKIKGSLFGNSFPPVTRSILHGGPGRPLKWDSRRYARLLVLYAELRIKRQMERNEAMAILSVIENIGFNGRDWRDVKKVEQRIAEARSDAEKNGWGAHLPEWAKPALSQRFKP